MYRILRVKESLLLYYLLLLLIGFIKRIHFLNKSPSLTCWQNYINSEVFQPWQSINCNQTQ
uniref:Uncharacterized protein n=1 Tax=Tetranychus urticae TaxID=32264 RepID=T1K7S7_TETUR